MCVSSSGFKDVEALKKALVANMRDSAIWGITYLYVRRWGNPEFRPRTSTFVQDGYFGALSVSPFPPFPPYNINIALACLLRLLPRACVSDGGI